MSENNISWGINIPWWNEGYCHDLGKNYIYPHWPVSFDEQLVSTTFTFLNSIDVDLFRFWLFEGGEGIVFNEEGKITGLDATFKKNLIRMVELVREHKLNVYWTLLDANSVFRNNDFITDSIIGNGGNTLLFGELILPEVLDIIKDTTWAIDVCNEPEAAIAGEHGNYSDKGYSWDRISGNLNKIIASIRKLQPEIKLSIGSGFQEERNLELGYYSPESFNLDFVDYHTHRTDGFVPQAEPLRNKCGNKPVVIGELSATEKLDSNLTKEQWTANQLLMNERLHNLLDEEYLAVFLWRMDPISTNNSRKFDSLSYRGENSSVYDFLRRQ